MQARIRINRVVAIEMIQRRHDRTEGEGGEPGESEQQAERGLVGSAQLQLDDIVHEEHGRQYNDRDERPDAKPSAVGHHVEPAIMQSDVNRERQRPSGQPGQDRQTHGRTAEPPDPGCDEHPD